MSFVYPPPSQATKQREEAVMTSDTAAHCQQRAEESLAEARARIARLEASETEARERVGGGGLQKRLG